MNTRTSLPAAIAVSLCLISACGGGDSETSAETDTTATTPTTEPTPIDPPVTDPPATDPPATDPPASTAPTTAVPSTAPATTAPPTTEAPEPELPAWMSGEFATVESDNGPLELPVELVPFCESSRSFYIAANGLDYLGDEQPLTAQQLFSAMAALSPMTIETAPSEEFAARPIAARDHLAVIIPAFEEIEYASDGLSGLDNADEVFTALGDFIEVRSSLQTFLIDVCGADDDVLNEESQSAVEIAADSVGETIEPDVLVEAAPGSTITNAAESIFVDVPDTWSQTTEQGSDYPQLLASADIDAFLMLSEPGVLVLRGEGGFRDGGFVGRVLTFASELEAAGCSETDAAVYNDGIYVGEERTYDCATDGLDVRLFGGTTEDEALYAMVLLVSPTDEPGIRQLIVDSFYVT